MYGHLQPTLQLQPTLPHPPFVLTFSTFFSKFFKRFSFVFFCGESSNFFFSVSEARNLPSLKILSACLVKYIFISYKKKKKYQTFEEAVQTSSFLNTLTHTSHDSSFSWYYHKRSSWKTTAEQDLSHSYGNSLSHLQR